MRRAFAAVFALLACTLVALPATARGFEIGFVDSLFTDPAPQVRAGWLDRARASGAQLVRLTVTWSQVAGVSPPGDPADPADPSYDFTALDAAVRDAAARGLDVLFTIGGAPTWAEGPDRPGLDQAPPGSWKPDPRAYGDFAAALAGRYSGTFDPPGSALVLPRVRYFQALNEPNLSTYLTPQWDGRRPVSPELYRALLNAFYERVKAVHPDNVVVSAGTAPFGSPPGGYGMRPLEFWQSLLCLGRYPGSLLPSDCGDPVQVDVVAHHPITGRPRSVADRGDITIPELGDLQGMVRAAEAAGTVVPAGTRPLWVTELWWETDPPDRFAMVTVGQQARWIAEGLYLIWKQGIDVTILFLIRDQPYQPADPFASLQSGVYFACEQADLFPTLQAGALFACGEPKPSLQSVRFPFVTERLSPSTLTAWGKAPTPGQVTIEHKVGEDWLALSTAPSGDDGVFETTVEVSGAAELRARQGGATSLIWRQQG